MMNVSTNSVVRRVKKTISRRRKRMIFGAMLLILPIIQFCIFYIYTHITMIVQAFTEYLPREGALGFDSNFRLIENFKNSWQTLADKSYILKNSLTMFVCTLLIGMPLELFFSFYIYKKFLGSGMFKVFLFLPNIVSSVVIALIFQGFVNDVIPTIIANATGSTKPDGLLISYETNIPTVIFYAIWSGMGVRMLMFSNAMGNISESIVESAQLDGVNYLQEFWYISFPMIFPTFITFIVTAIAGICTNQMHLYTFYGSDARGADNIAYYIYRMATHADIYNVQDGYLTYSQLSALGLMLTCVLVPTTLLVKKMMEKFGPSTD